MTVVDSGRPIKAPEATTGKRDVEAIAGIVFFFFSLLRRDLTPLCLLYACLGLAARTLSFVTVTSSKRIQVLQLLTDQEAFFFSGRFTKCRN